MCSGSKSDLCLSNSVMEAEPKERADKSSVRSSILLELSASDDPVAFKTEVEGKDVDIDEASFWYGRRIGSKKVGFEERTPLMIAAIYGSIEVLKYIISTGKVDVNKACGSDKVTALHCAVSGCATSTIETIKILLDASADVNQADANGNKPVDLISQIKKPGFNSRRKVIEELLKNGTSIDPEELEEEEEEQKSVKLSEKKEYPIDTSLPDINNGIYGTDEFRMYTFKVKPCSRAYSHDWTECPFAHPGENARRRDPRKYPYSCVPCPEFRKGSCAKSDACEYAHGVFESWLHPAQYRTRLCKDETNCTRKVCFFAHKPEELRPVHVSTGSAIPSPRSGSVTAPEMPVLSSLALGSTSLAFSTAISTPPMSPLAPVTLSPRSGGLWQNKVNNLNLNNLTSPALQLSGSRLKTALRARDLNMELEFLGLDNINSNNQFHHQQLLEQISGLSSSPRWNNGYSRVGDLNPPNGLEKSFGSVDSSMSPRRKPVTPTQRQSPPGFQNMNQVRTSYASDLVASPIRKQSPLGFDTSAAVAQAVMNSRSSAFVKRSQSFIDRGAANASVMSSNLSNWGSPDGKLDWGVHGDELNKLRRSVSFGFRNNGPRGPIGVQDSASSNVDEPDISWVNSLVRDAAPDAAYGSVSAENRRKYGVDEPQGVQERFASWVEQMYIEQEQMVA